jgi:uncharacterized phage protein (TIGR02220 family)
MPDRIVRAGILTSDRVNALSWAGEVFYRRLMSVVDDFGRYDGRLSVIRGAIYSLKLDRVSDSDIGKWIRECEEAGLVRRYTVEDKPFIELPKFGQKIRAKFSKWPDPPTSANTCQQVSANVPVVVSVVVDEDDSLSGKPDAAQPGRVNGKKALVEAAADVMGYLNRNAGKGFEFRNRSGELTASADRIIQRLKQGYTAEELKEVVYAKCEQWKDDDKMAEYLRPATLFAKENFEQYLGEIRGANG